MINKEREGAFLGKTVQVVPHITDEIKRNFKILGESGEYDIVITELGGTVGDIESLPYIEAVRQFKWEVGSGNAIVIHLTLIPFLAAAGELKTKPTQHSVKMLLEYGIQPDILVCRTEHHINMDIRKKIALFCNVNINAVIESIDASTIYDVPLLMLKEQLDKTVLTKLKLSHKHEPDLESWKDFLGRLKNPTSEVKIGLVGKYVELPDAYKSIVESFIHAGSKNECKVKVDYIHSEQLTPENAVERLKGLHGVLVAPGFGQRGFEGKIEAIRYVRENNIPFFGICLGMQCAVVEYGRNVLGLKEANSTEMNPDTPHPVINMMEDQKKIVNKGGTMRLGAYPCDLKKGSKALAIYGKAHISERHRHRFEFNNAYLKDYESAGLTPSGINPENNLVEIVELKNHPFFVGAQFHPELKSTVANPHPLFINFVAASMAYARKN